MVHTDDAAPRAATGYVRVGRGDGTVVTDPDADVDDTEPVRFQPEGVTDHR